MGGWHRCLDSQSVLLLVMPLVKPLASLSVLRSLTSVWGLGILVMWSTHCTVTVTLRVGARQVCSDDDSTHQEFGTAANTSKRDKRSNL